MVDRQRFTTLIEPHLDILYRQAWRLCGNAADAEDLLQELMLKLYPRLDDLVAIEQLRPWLTRVLYRLFIDMKRRQTRSPLYLAVDNSADTDSGDPLDEQISAEPEPLQHLEQQIDRQRLANALTQLSDDHRTVLTLHDMEGYSLPEIADILECPLGTLKSRLHRAREKLRTTLGYQ